MRIQQFIIFFLLIGFYSCGQSTTKRQINPEITRLSNHIIPLVNHLNNPDSCKKALSFLDSATKLDNNCYLCHYNKLMFLVPLKQFERAIETMNECIRIKPYAHDLYLYGGILYEKIGDTVSSSTYFNKSLSICNNVLDTMSPHNNNYEMLIANQAVNLIMSGKHTEGKATWKKLYNAQTDSTARKVTLSMMQMDKKELVTHLIN